MYSKFNIKKRDIMITPEEAFVDLDTIYGIDLRNAYDPCPYPESEVDGLTCDWKSPAYVNPPFSKALLWVKKAIIEAEKGCEIYMMLPYYVMFDRTTTKWGNSAVTKFVKDLEYTQRIKYTFTSPFENEKKCEKFDIRFFKFSQKNK